MSTKYVPILRWKAGEKNCLEHLESNVSNKIIPFIKVSTPSASNIDDAAEKKMQKLFNSFNLSWDNKPFYLYLTEDRYDGIDESNHMFEIYKTFLQNINHPFVIPAFDLNDEINVSNCANLPNSNGVCLRISINQFENSSDTLNYYISNSWIRPENTDLLIDLKFIDSEIYPKKAALTTIISDIFNIAQYRRIIISSCSFPKDISSLQSDIVNEFLRYEATIHDICLKLQNAYSFNYVYSDYGPINLNDMTFILGMAPNFKIKYTTKNKYLVVKGLSTKKGGLDLVNVIPCCQKLIDHPQYSGSTFSYGDRIIAEIASGSKEKGGNLTNWVSYNFNHHITLIVSLL